MVARAICLLMVSSIVAACGGNDDGDADTSGPRVGEVEVQGVSMEPTLRDATKLEVFAIPENKPGRRDIIVFRPTTHPDRNFIKRVIGLPGDTVEIDQATGAVQINGDRFPEEYVSGPTECIGTCRWELPNEGTREALNRCASDACYFVMGDNREDPGDSADSRKGFLVTPERIIGRVQLP